MQALFYFFLFCIMQDHQAPPFSEPKSGQVSVREAISSAFATTNSNLLLSILFLLVVTAISLASNQISKSIPFFAIIGALFITPQLSIGFSLGADAGRTNGKIQFGDFFGGFKFAIPLALGNLMIFLVALVAVIPLIVWMFAAYFDVFKDLAENPINTPDEVMSFFGQLMLPLLIFIPYTLIISIFLYFIPELLVFQKLPVTKAVSTSFRLGKSHFGAIFLSLLASLGLLILGVICLFIGLLYFAPVVSYTKYHLFCQITGWGSSESSELTHNLVVE